MNRRDAIAALVSLPEVSRITVARPKPDDVILVECSGRITQEAAERIQSYLSKVWPDRRIVVLGDDVRIKLVEG